MKIHSVLLFVAAVACSCFAGCGNSPPAQIAPQIKEIRQPISFQYDYAAGLETARRERKPVLIFFSVPNNVGSQRMMETTFCDDEIKRLADWIVCIHVDGSREPALCESLEIFSFPTIVLSDTNGTEVHRLVGRQTPDQLAVQIHVLLQTAALRLHTVAER